MNWLDLIFIPALAAGVWLGTKSGFFWQITRLVLLIITAYITFLVHPPMARWLASKMSDQFLAKVIIYIFIFVIIYLMLFFITWFIERSLIKLPLKTLDKVLGGVFGFLKTALICGTILLGLVYYPMTSIQGSIRNSWLGPYMLIYTRKVVFLMPKAYKRKVKRFIDQVREEKVPPAKSGEPQQGK